MILLDTSVFVHLILNEPLKPAARQATASNARNGGLLVSAVTAWEIGLLGNTRHTGLKFQPDSRSWFLAASRAPGIKLLPLSITAAIEAAWLPGGFHADPGDRMLVATAREEGVAIVTNDRRILAYAAAGHVEAIAA